MCKRAFALVWILFLFGGCATVPKDDINVIADSDPRVDFGAYQTYAWVEAVGIVNDPEGHWEQPQFNADTAIISHTNDALHERGLKEEKSNPDLLLAFGLGVDMAAMQLKQYPNSTLRTLENIPRAALTMFMVDTETSIIVWAGVATADYKNLPADAAQQRLKFAIEEMFKQFPK